MVLNQVDRLPVADAQQCLAHLRRLVAEDGLSDAVVIGTSNRSGKVWRRWPNGSWPR